MRLNATRLGSIASSRSFGDQLYDLAGLVPNLDLNFAGTKTLDPRVTFTRASSGTYVGSDGLLKTAAVDAPRFDHNPTTGESLGLLVEEARTNSLLNSAILSTQSVTVGATYQILSFYGTGTVTLTGVSTAGPLVGTGENNRVSLTFTPTAGVLILTVSGSVTNAQLEAPATAPSSPSSYIPTTTSTVTRAADVASITEANFSSWYNQTEGTIFVEGSSGSRSGTPSFFQLDDGTTFERIQVRRNALSGAASLSVRDGNVTQATVDVVGYFFNTMGKTCAVYSLNDFQLAFNGTLGISDTLGTLPTVDRASIGGGSSVYINGTIKRLTFWPTRLSNIILQAISQP